MENRIVWTEKHWGCHFDHCMYLFLPGALVFWLHHTHILGVIKVYDKSVVDFRWLTAAIGIACSGLSDPSTALSFELATLHHPLHRSCFILLSKSFKAFLNKKEFPLWFLLFAPLLAWYDLSVCEAVQTNKCFFSIQSKPLRQKETQVCAHTLKHTQCN